MRTPPKITIAFSKLFDIRPTEWPRLLLFYLMFFIYIAGATWGETIVAASFLEQVGVEFLPWVFIGIAVISIPVTALYTAFADRVSNNKLVIAILLIGVIGITIGRVLLGTGQDTLAYPFLYLLMFVPLSDIFVIHWYTYVNGYYDTRSAKRIIPVLATSARVGNIVAGLSMGLLTSYLSPANIILVWLSALIMVVLLVWLTPNLLKDGAKEPELAPDILTSPGADTDQSPHESYLENIREGYHFVIQSSFLRWMALFTLALMVMVPLVEFRVSEILIGELKTTENIANFLGPITGITNLLMLPILLFGLSRLIGRVGLGNANLIFPTGTALICGVLIFQPGLPSAGLAYFGQKAFRAAFRGPIDSLLYNAVSLRVKGRARAFIGGLLVPVGSAIGGGLLLLRPFVPVSWFLSALIGLLALAYFGSALVIGKQYARALIRMLEQEDFSFLISQEASDLSVTDPATLNELRKRLEESPSPEFSLFMAQLISQIGGSEAVPILHEAAKNAANAQNRAAIIDVLAAADISGEAVRQFYIDYLADANPQVRRSAIAGLARLAITKDEQFVRLALEMLTDQDFDVRVHVLSLLAEIENLSELHPANAVLNQLLADPDPHRRTQGVQILGQVVQQQVANQQADGQNLIYKLTAYLADPDDQVRLETAITIEKLSQISLPEAVAEFILTKIRASEHDPVERVRQAALKIMGKLGSREFYQDLMAGLADPSQPVRETAMDVLVQIGKPIIPLAHPLLDSTNLQMRKMAAIVLSQISPKQFGGLIESQIAGNLLAIYRNCGYIDALSSYQEYSSIATVQNVLQEQNEQLQVEIFFLLGTFHDRASVDVIVDSLRSPDTRVRANAIEALESLTSPQTAQLIAPLFDPNQTTNLLLGLSQDTWDMQQPDAATTIKQIIANSETFWPRAILIYALGELGLSLSSGQTDSDNGESEQNQDSLITNPDTTQSKKRRIRSIDLMSLLSNGDQEPSVEPEPAEEMPAKPVPLTLAEIEALLEVSAEDTAAEVRSAVSTARRMLAGVDIVEEAKKEKILLSTVEKIIFLKQVPFFKGMTVHQLDVLAKICEEEFFNEDQWVFNQGDPGGILYVIVTGSVGIEQEKRKGSFARLATLGPYHYFGEMSLLDNGPRSAAALAVQDTLTLRLRREPLIALARQYPDVSLELIQVLSERLRQANNRIADLTRARPRELQKLFDQLD